MGAHVEADVMLSRADGADLEDWSLLQQLYRCMTRNNILNVSVVEGDFLLLENNHV